MNIVRSRTFNFQRYDKKESLLTVVWVVCHKHDFGVVFKETTCI